MTTALPVTISSCDASSPAVLAALHRANFQTAWTAVEFAGLLATPGAGAFIADDSARTDPSLANDPAGFVLYRCAGDEAEILALAVTPDRRRAGIATALLERALNVCAETGVVQLFLEVAADNEAAINCYRRSGFVDIARRPHYYRKAGQGMDAIVMRCDVVRRS